MEKKIRFMSIEHVMIFERENKKSDYDDKIWVSVFNGQVSERYYETFHVKSYRVIQNCTDEHEVISILSYYYSNGYKLIEFKRKRITVFDD